MGYCSTVLSGGRGMMRGGMFGMGILWWILIAVVIIGAIYILKNRTNQQRETNHSPYQPTHSSAFDVLDEEFAKGNLTEEEYLHKKEVLKK
ncbi:hypothetical protein A5819_000292 [Enterococcus sp. 7E2_DIV0204]|uniref:SHOCT domain-containing protein n=1 Tax=Candidatus Enterococcus lemimoniae TaxID=1834167 RepID=A0ABZ2T9P7_9ENTE|nr:MULTISPECIES: hypothetical protein [unclassified Enterococcus]OTN87844.1 hypothetical protein A5819_000292 [Enterococcus sp. 7E2_DIV0204]OTO70017.1 hypothetical protein A5866_002235 [Enterococcus sp. 12C11_DIV0727]OTP49473.1 hypothetical protein A5884_002671 [Enterococcus sp. 7D2_DIV0200]